MALDYITQGRAGKFLMKRSLKVTITRTRRRTINVPAGMLCVHCPVCRREVETLSKTQAISFLGIEEEIFEDLTAAGLIHAIQTVSGHLRVCKDSVL